MLEDEHQQRLPSCTWHQFEHLRIRGECRYFDDDLATNTCLRKITLGFINELSNTLEDVAPSLPRPWGYFSNFLIWSHYYLSHVIAAAKEAYPAVQHAVLIVFVEKPPYNFISVLIPVVNLKTDPYIWCILPIWQKISDLFNYISQRSSYCYGFYATCSCVTNATVKLVYLLSSPYYFSLLK